MKSFCRNGSFNSLQTGKPFRTCRMQNVAQRIFLYVSIPFKRESPFGHVDKGVSFKTTPPKFQFPSNGKALSDGPLAIVPLLFGKFQFPSNGKALSDSIDGYNDANVCFNSLQTGKPFRTRINGYGRKVFRHLCFNSLQTGKPFRTSKSLVGKFLSPPRVSIPFKRESPFGLAEHLVR